MKRCYLIFMLGLVAIPSLAFQTNVGRSPVPDWLDPFPNSGPDMNETWPYYYLDFEKQIHLPNQTVFHRYRYQVLTVEGMQEMSDISVNFDPSFQKLIFHRIGIERNDTFSDQLDLQKVTTANTESGNDGHLYDGSMTAFFHLDGVQKGDIIEIAYSIEGFNPVHQGHFATNLYLGFTIPVNHFNYRVFAGNKQAVYYTNINQELEPTLRKTEDGTVYTWTSRPTGAVELEDNLPIWTLDLPMTSLSTQKNWAEVTKWALPLYDTNPIAVSGIDPIPETLEPDEKILALIRWVQDEIRYLGLESGIGAYKPNPPRKVFSQKFGDCKDKSLLLVALLRKEGIPAYPMLVNTSYKHNLEKLQPSNSAFDHCVVALSKDDTYYFVDPTISNQGGDLDHHYFPDYGVGLLIKENVSELIALPKPKKSVIDIRENIYVDSIGGQAMMQIKTIYRGAKADDIRSEFENNPLFSIQKDYLNFYNNLYPGIAASEDIKFFDENRYGSNEVLVEENYKIENFWLPEENQSVIYSRVYPLVLESMINYPGTTARKSPYYLGSPFSFKQETQVMLPESWLVQDAENQIEGPLYRYSHQIKGFGERISVKYAYDLEAESIAGDLAQEFLSAQEKIKNGLMFTLTYNIGLVAGEKSYPALIVFSLLMLAGIWLGLKVFRNFDPDPWIYAENKAIGGWLVLPAIGICITPFRIAYDLYTVGYLDKVLWAKASNLGLTGVIAYEMVYNALFLSFSHLLIVLFFSRRTSLPRLIVIFYAVNLLAVLVDNFLASEVSPIGNQQIIQAGIAAAIWIPYFSLSERVKSTFCKTYHTRLVEQAGASPLPM